MDTIFRFNKYDKVVLFPEAVKLAPKCKKLNPEELHFVVLAFDWHSILKRYPKADRIRKAKRIVWNKDDGDDFFPEKEQKIIEAIEEYEELQYDENRALRDAYRSKITILQDQIMVADPSKIKTLDEAIERLQKRIKETEVEIFKNDDTALLKGGDRLSFIETWQRNQQKAKKDKARIKKSTDSLMSKPKSTEDNELHADN